MGEELIFLRPEQIQPDPGAIRHEPGDLAALAASIAGVGLLQPIGVIHMWGDTYRVAYGHRRLEAARMAGLERIPCLLLDVDPDELFVPQLVENLHRLDLNDMEKAEAIARLRGRLERQQPHLSEGELDAQAGRAIGLSARTVRRYLSLLELSPAIQELIRQGALTVTQAQHLLRIPNEGTREEVAREAAEGGLTAAQVSELASFFAANPTLTIETALQALEAGARLPREVSPEAVEGPPERLARIPLEEEEERVWEEAEEGEEAGLEAADWARLRRFRSLDEVLDGAGRITRTLYEGDLERWAERDAQAPVKVRLLLRQLRAVVEAIERFCQARGWPLE
ncbi:MAG: ParB/RepB/Spo0J family partition protein [Chloroflexia bacterium]